MRAWSFSNRTRICQFVCSMLGLAPWLSLASLQVKPAQMEKQEPLIMENADRFEGYRSRGEYILSGKVRFRHGTLRLETERAVWLKDRNIVFCESGMRIVQRGAVLTADRGNYDKNRGEASAEGHVFMRDSSGEVEATGRSILYNRDKHLTTLTGDPELRRFYAPKDTSAKLPDTLSIKGDLMIYDDSTQVAVADGTVRINRDKLKITCKKAEYHDAADSLYLLGEPLVIADDNQIRGQIMRLGMHGEDIRSLLVKGAAQAHSLEPATDTSTARQSDVKGDSLFLTFKNKAIDSVEVFKNTSGTYYDLDKPEYVNKMSGNYMVLRFGGKQVRSANVLGSAKSSYYHFEQKRLKGRNDAEGDTIEFAFKEGKIDEVTVKGQAKGTYFGERLGKSKTDSSATPIPKSVPDSLAPAKAEVPASREPSKSPTGQSAPVAKPWRKR
jgi:lipopolysaccharide export system protein LptA